MSDYSSVATFLGALLIMLALFRLFTLEKRMDRLSVLDGKVEALLKQARVQYNPFDGLSGQVIDAIKRQKKIEAIKHYRSETGVGLKEAKEFIEEVQRRAGKLP